MGSTGTQPKKRPFQHKSQDSKLDSEVALIPFQSKSKEPCNNLTRYLHLLDAKTRRQNSLPREEDALAGRLQLFIYRTLLRELIALDPPYDFDHLWETLGVDPAASLPTRFLVQVQLIPDNDDFATISLNDLAASWHRLVEGEKLHISLVLELVYYRRPPNNENGMGKERAVSRSFINREDEGITEAIAASEASSNGAGSSDYGHDLPFQPVSRSEAVAFQLALERSLHSQSSSTKSTSPNSGVLFSMSSQGKLSDSV
jgi:exonuclease V